jgi:hypothetical protein
MALSRIAVVLVTATVALGTGFASACYASPPTGTFSSQASNSLRSEPSAFPSTVVSPTPLFEREVAVLTRRGITRTGAVQALRVQGMIARASLVSKEEAALGQSFAGVWFDSATARLVIGATSAQDRRTAERVAAQAGLAGEVTVVPVRSTMAQLLSGQRRWNRKLAKLFASEGVETSIEPQRNAVSVTLGSSVPSAKRTALAHEAKNADVNVRVTVPGVAKLGITTQAGKTECNKFIKNAANCNKSITSGVSIESKAKCNSLAEVKIGMQFYESEPECLKLENPGKGDWERKIEVCTAGPLAIPVAKKKERVLITAGHCIEHGGGVGNEWLAYNRKTEEGVIGKAREFSNGGAEGAKIGDFGDITIEPGSWQTGQANDPTLAVTAEWKKAGETSYPVRGEQTPVAFFTNCHEGQASGESCGEIRALNVTLKDEGKYKEGLVEEQGENLIGEGGDSGGPWLFIETGGEALMEGSHVGYVPYCVELAEEKTGPEYFESKLECVSLEYKEEAGNKGAWERTEYSCAKVAKTKGPRIYKSKKECEENENAGEGEGEWERSPSMHLVFEPLKQPVKGAAEGSLEKLKLELLTTSNEVIKPRLKNTSGKSLIKDKFTSKSGGSTFETAGGAKMACSAGTNKGEATGTNSGTLTITFTGCEGFAAKCSTAGAAEGEVVLSAKYQIAFSNLAEEKPVFVVEFTSVSIECGTPCPKMIDEKLKLHGVALGVATPANKVINPTEVLTLTFSQTKGVPSVKEYENEEGKAVKAVLELEGSGSKSFGEQAGLSDTDELTFEEAAELEAP